MKIYCMNCKIESDVRLTDGKEIYPHRPDLCSLPFWICKCGGYVGCHYKTDNPTKPLGIIPNDEMKVLRQQIHKLLDPLWKSNRLRRKDVYAELSKVLHREYHTGELRTLQEVEYTIEALHQIRQSVGLISIRNKH